MSWYNKEGNCPQYYIWSKTRYIRNLSRIPFGACAENQQAAEACRSIDALLSQNGFRKEAVPTGRSLEVFALGERQFVDGDFIDAEAERALYLNEPCNLAVAIGGKNLITIQSVLSGRALAESQNIAAGAEELLDGEFEFAYSERLGYLSPDPTECGSGAEFRVALYLPALARSEQIERARSLCQRAGVTLSPLSLHPHNTGDVFLVSKRASTHCCEADERCRLEAICDKLTQNEAAVSRMIFKDKSKLIYDKAWRAFGILRYAREVDEAEFLSLLSDLRLALTHNDGSSPLPPVSFVTLSSLLADGLNASVATAVGSVCRSEEECRTARAKLISCRLQALEAAEREP
ncbi:MAG: hypothetical protein IJY39_12315 [Clostridia bacterium]|nr:hypothetical protein [Clostridia bacterium]